MSRPEGTEWRMWLASWEVLSKAHLGLMRVDMGIGQKAQNKSHLSPFPATRPPQVRRPVARTAPQKTCLTVRLRRNVMAQNIGGTGMPTPAARWDKPSLRAPAAQARNGDLGKNPFFPRLSGESDGCRRGT